MHAQDPQHLVAWSPDSLFLCSASHGSDTPGNNGHAADLLHIFEVANGACLLTIPCTPRLSRVIWHPAGTCIMLVSALPAAEVRSQHSWLPMPACDILSSCISACACDIDQADVGIRASLQRSSLNFCCEKHAACFLLGNQNEMVPCMREISCLLSIASPV